MFLILILWVPLKESKLVSKVSINFGQTPGSCSYKLFNSWKQVFLKSEPNLWIIFVKELILSWKSVTSLIANSFKCTLAFPANNNLFIVNDKNKNTKTRCEMCLKLFTLRSNVSVADLEQTVEALKMNVSLSLVYVKKSQFINNARYYIPMRHLLYLYLLAFKIKHRKLWKLGKPLDLSLSCSFMLREQWNFLVQV